MWDLGRLFSPDFDGRIKDGLRYCKNCAFVPRLMTSDQQAHCVQVCQDLLDHSENDKEFLSKIITGDELWVYGYDMET